MYYRYYMHRADHNVYAHYGIRTRSFKLIYYYESEPDPPEWELFDLQQDPLELNSVYANPAYADAVHDLTKQLHLLRVELGDLESPWDGESQTAA
jgi:hypothetical protein